MRSRSLQSIDAQQLKRPCPQATTPPLAKRIRDVLRDVLQNLRRQYFIRVWHMQIGEGSVVSFSARLDKTNPQGVHIGKYSVVTFGATILAHDWVNSCHKDVYIGDSCFIGAHSIVLPGVRIGDHCIVAASTLVARDIPDSSLVAGNPGRVVERNIKTGHYGVRRTTGSGAETTHQLRM